MVFEKIREHLKDILLCNDEDITMDTQFGTDIVIDSVDLVDLMVRLEEDFGITIAEDDAYNVKSVGDVVRLVEEKMKK